MVFVRQMVIFFMENEKLLTGRINRRKIANDLSLGRVEANWLSFYQKKKCEVIFLFSCSCCPNSFGVLLKLEFLTVLDLIIHSQNHFLNYPTKCKIQKNITSMKLTFHSSFSIFKMTLPSSLMTFSFSLVKLTRSSQIFTSLKEKTTF